MRETIKFATKTTRLMLQTANLVLISLQKKCVEPAKLFYDFNQLYKKRILTYI